MCYTGCGLVQEGQSAMTEKLTSLDSQMRCEVSALTRFANLG